MKKLIYIIILLFFIPSVSFSEAGERLSINGYNLHICATKLSSKVYVTCEIKGGKSTDRLYVVIRLIDESGKIIQVQDSLKEYSYSGKFIIKKPLRTGGNRWKVQSVQIYN